MKRIFLIALTLVFALFSKTGKSLEFDIEGGVAQASVNKGTPDEIHVFIETVELSRGHFHEKAFMWGGDENSPPKKVIKRIEIIRNYRKQKIFIPLSAYADLGNPKSISLLVLPTSRFRLVIVGGDAAGAYSAILEFKKNEILSRRVISGEFPKEVWEKTVYSFNHLNN